MRTKKKKNILDIIDEEAKRQIEEIEQADIVVGIPSFNNEKTIGHVVRAAEYGLAKYFPNQKAVLVNSDGGSTDRTKEAVRDAGVYHHLHTILIDHPVSPAAQVIATYNGIPGKGSALRAIFEIADRLGAKVCVLLDSDLRSVTPEWIELLARPIIRRGYDYVAPYYSRHKYDGTITNMIVYPLTRALYGKRVRQPIGGDFGISKRLIKTYLEKDVWNTDVARYGIDIWMTTVAINEDFRICQAFLGAKIHDAKDPSKSLGPMFKQVVATVFRLMKEYENRWKEVKESTPTAMYGFVSEVYPEPVEITLEPMIEKFRIGLKENETLWSSFLPKERLDELNSIASLSTDKFNFPVEVWVKTVYDFAVAFNKTEDIFQKERIVESMTSLYFGRVASFVVESKDLKTYDAELLIETQALKFEELKPYLLEKWG
ncbi:MAG: glycosyl transferase [Deltaproteobacteria bacterium]|jgi:glycosyltransferase involved in cell wall biosynthesis|nr:MAG: glycosyl transferase [Deltaproteobacteria bacterium]